MKFKLIERTDDLRVVLAKSTDKIDGEVIREIEAKTWLDARLTISDFEFIHDPGYGYFRVPRPGTFERQTAYENRCREDAARMTRLINEKNQGG